MNHKYIRLENLGFVIWPMTNKLSHHQMAKFVESWEKDVVISAGFVNFDDKGNVFCNGRAESIGISSDINDTRLLCKQLNLIYKD